MKTTQSERNHRKLRSKIDYQICRELGLTKIEERKVFLDFVNKKQQEIENQVQGPADNSGVCEIL